MRSLYTDNVRKLWDISDKGTVWLHAFVEPATPPNVLICPIHNLILFIKAPQHRYSTIIPMGIWNQIVNAGLVLSPPRLFIAELQVQSALGLLHTSPDHSQIFMDPSAVWEVDIEKMSKHIEQHTSEKTNEVR